MRSPLTGRNPSAFAMLLSLSLFLAAAASAAIGYHGDVPAYYAIAVGLIILAILVPQCLIIADQWERMIVLRLGKLYGIRGRVCS
jgi:hypothetical protein